MDGAYMTIMGYGEVDDDEEIREPVSGLGLSFYKHYEDMVGSDDRCPPHERMDYTNRLL